MRRAERVELEGMRSSQAIGDAVWPGNKIRESGVYTYP